MKRACVIGWPIEHSRSPLIHGYWLKKYGIAGSYTKEAVKPEDLEAFIGSLAANGFAGCNVTVPHKEAAFAVAEFKDPSALAVAACNTIWLEGGKIACANTDTYGFMRHIELSAPEWNKRDRPILVLGAGGAARGIVHGLIEAGAGEIHVVNRSRARSDRLAHDLGRKVHSHGWEARNTFVRDAGLIVNATTLGMKGAGDPGIDFGLAPSDAIAVDIVYVPLETAFLKSARDHGLKGVDGLGMLLHQAVPGFEKWFRIRPEVTPELRALLAADIEGR